MPAKGRILDKATNEKMRYLYIYMYIYVHICIHGGPDVALLSDSKATSRNQFNQSALNASQLPSPEGPLAAKKAPQQAGAGEECSSERIARQGRCQVVQQPY